MSRPTESIPGAAELRDWLDKGIGESLDEDPSGFMLGIESVSAVAILDELVAERDRLREALDAALNAVDEPYPLEVFPERSDEQRDAIFAAMRAVDKYATEWFYAHVARDRGRVARLTAAEVLAGEPG